MKRKKREHKAWCLSLVLCMLVCVCFGCGKGKEPEVGKSRIYYLDTEETQLVEESYALKSDTVEGKIEEILKLLSEDPEDIDCKSVFISGVRVESWEIKETKLSLYFNEKYYSLDAPSQLLLRAAVVQSLVQTAGVDYIRFYVGGNPLTDGTGNEIGYMRAEDFVQNVGSTLHSYQTANLTLYFSNSDGDRLSPEQKSVRYNSNISIEKLIVEQLIKGPAAPENKAVIAAGTKILGVSVRENVCYVNFDEGYLGVAEQVNPKIAVYALVNSIIDGGAASQVQILVNGETNIAYQEIIDLSKPFSRDGELIEE